MVMYCKRVFCAAIAAAAACAAAQGSAVADSPTFLAKGVMLPEVEKVGNASRRSNSSSLDAGVVKLDKENLLNLPTMTGEPDIIRAFAMQPGVSEGVEGFSGLYVRGAGNDQNLILLNGVPLYQISHLAGCSRRSTSRWLTMPRSISRLSLPCMAGGCRAWLT